MATISVSGGSGLGTGNLGQATPGNYADVYGFDNAPANTNLPAIYDREVMRYGNRSLSGLFRLIGSEEAVNSRQIQWAEQTRKHIAYNRVRRANAGAEDFLIYQNDTTVVTTGNGSTALNNHAVRVGDKVLIGSGSTSHIAVVSNVSDNTVTLRSYLTVNTGTADAGFPSLGSGTTDLNLLVIGNESEKGSDSPEGTIQPQYLSFTNNMIIIRKYYDINGSDTAQIGWVRGQTEGGETGYYWFLKGKNEEKERFEDYTEIQILEERPAVSGSPAATAVSGELGARQGSRGLFYEIRERGNTATGGFVDNGTAEAGRDDFDMFVAQWDREGAIEENVFYLNRTQSLNIDDILATQNSYGAGGTSWGLFNNDKDMALNLGFKGWRRGSYDFYKSDWKYLNQTDGRGSFGGVQGVAIPMGSKQVYDGYGTKKMDPFVSIKYLASEHDNRRMKSWVHGSVGGNYTSGLDAMQVEFLSERCLQLQAANNFFILT